VPRKWWCTISWTSSILHLNVRSAAGDDLGARGRDGVLPKTIRSQGTEEAKLKINEPPSNTWRLWLLPTKPNNDISCKSQWSPWALRPNNKDKSNSFLPPATCYLATAASRLSATYLGKNIVLNAFVFGSTRRQQRSSQG